MCAKVLELDEVFTLCAVEDKGDFLEGFFILYDLAHTGVELKIVFYSDAAEVFPEEVEVTLCGGV